jgi:hypothetical protein
MLSAESDPLPPTDACRPTADESLLDLIEGHNSPRILLKTQCYPTGARRVVVKEVFYGDPVIVAGSPLRLKRDRSEQQRVESSVIRTRKTIAQRCMAIKADRLLTLTYRENMEDRGRCYRDTIRFVEKARGAGLLRHYVAVPEQQKRGAWHVHIAIAGYMPVITLRRLWREVVGSDNGNIDLSYRHRGESNPWRIASYLAKYIGKAIGQCQPGERTFWASEWAGLQPICRAVLLAPGVALTQVLGAIWQVLSKEQELGRLRTIDKWQPTKKLEDPGRLSPPVVVWAV